MDLIDIHDINALKMIRRDSVSRYFNGPVDIVQIIDSHNNYKVTHLKITDDHFAHALFY